MTTGVFLERDGELIEMRKEAYATEALFQELLAKHPSVLAGDQIDPASPRRWALVRREMGVPDQEGAGVRWSMDHLFIDQDGIPTFVEVKRSSDTRSRREVVAQMLDYAANALAYWPLKLIRQRFEENCAERNQEPDTELDECFGIGDEVEGFWQKVNTNLQAGRLRLLFVADAIPPELQRIVEFLNEQMRTTEVLAVEITQYLAQTPGGPLRTMVPRVIGRTAAAQQNKRGDAGNRQWDKDRFLETLADHGRDELLPVAEELMSWSERNSDRISWGSGVADASFSPLFVLGRSQLKPFHLYSDGGGGWLNAKGLRGCPPFLEHPEKLDDYLRRLGSIQQIQLSEEHKDGWHGFNPDGLVQQVPRSQFIAALDWFALQVGDAAAETASTGRRRVDDTGA